MSHLFHEHQYIIFDYHPAGLETKTVSVDDYGDYQITHFSGQALGEHSLLGFDFSSQDIFSLDIKDLADYMGEWIAVAERSQSSGREFLVFADAFGYGSIFYAYINNYRFVISDSFHGVAAALHELRCEPTLNIANYVASLTSPLTYFQNAFSDQTMLEEIRILRPDEFIHINSISGVSFESRSSLGRAATLKEYDSALESGIALAHAVLDEVSSRDPLHSRITLSGGVDSRVVLSMLISSGQYKNYSVFSVDPRGWKNLNTRSTIERDIKLANKMRQDYKLPWWAPGHRDAVAVNFQEGLAAYQSHRSNLSYSFNPVEMLSYHRNPTTTLRGGGGEILSATSGGLRLASLFNETSRNFSPAEWFSRHLTKSSRVTSHYKPLIRDYVHDVYEDFALDSIRETYENFYFNTRNRAHFGHMNYSLTTNDLSLQMLSNPYFLQASQLVSFEEKANGRLMKDIFMKTQPELLEYEFESAEWSKRLIGDRPDSADPGNNWSSSYDQAIKATGGLHFLEGHEPNASSQTEKVKNTTAGINYLRSLFYFIEDIVPGHQRANLQEQHALILRQIEEGKFNLFRSLAKAASALDGFVPQPVLGTKLIRYCSDNVPPREARLPKPHANKAFSYPGPQYDSPVFEQNPTLSHTESGLEVESNFKANDDHTSYQFAYYLIKDGTRVEQRWYEEASKALFVNNHGPGNYHAIAHVRYKGRSRPAFYSKTNEIHI